MLEIIESHNELATPHMRDAGLRHLAIEVSDFATVFAKLRMEGVSFVSEPETSAGNTLAFFRDCDGSLLHLLHREKPLP